MAKAFRVAAVAWLGTGVVTAAGVSCWDKRLGFGWSGPGDYAVTSVLWPVLWGEVLSGAGFAVWLERVTGKNGGAGLRPARPARG